METGMILITIKDESLPKGEYSFGEPLYNKNMKEINMAEIMNDPDLLYSQLYRMGARIIINLKPKESK